MLFTILKKLRTIAVTWEKVYPPTVINQTVTAKLFPLVKNKIILKGVLCRLHRCHLNVQNTVSSTPP